MSDTPLRYLDSDPVAFRVLNEIGIIAQLTRAAMEEAVPAGVSGAGFSVLNHLARLPGDWSPARLARAFQVTKGAMTNTLQRLEAEGLIRVEADPRDGRAKLVRLLKKGLKVRDATLARLAPGMAALTEAVGANLFETLLPHLAALRATLDAARD
jgi:DNA-binding MarR family transcriptional regulator